MESEKYRAIYSVWSICLLSRIFVKPPDLLFYIFSVPWFQLAVLCMLLHPLKTRSILLHRSIIGACFSSMELFLMLLFSKICCMENLLSRLHCLTYYYWACCILFWLPIAEIVGTAWHIIAQLISILCIYILCVIFSVFGIATKAIRSYS